MIRILSIALLLTLVHMPSFAATEQAITFTSSDGQSTDAFEGQLMVPENRANPNSRQITIHYVRFPATTKNPGSPIIYLAGGPGGSGIRTAKNRRFELFMAMRAHGDVIALDQRGTGVESDRLHCRSSLQLPLDGSLAEPERIELKRKALTECLSFWQQAGVDIYGYTTPESVADIEDLRLHLNAERVSLWGISYGSHLALAALKTMSDRLDRVIIATVEGLDQTIKQPARTDQYFDRLQLAINTKASLREQFPDIKGMMRRVHAKLEKTPLSLLVPTPASTSASTNGGMLDLKFGKSDMQRMASVMISDPQYALQLMQLYNAIEQGITEPLVQVLQMFGDLEAPISYSAMATGMDLASGQSQTHYDLVMRQAKTALLGSQLNGSIHLTDVIPDIDLGDQFREAPVSEVPTLVLRGTLDGRIYLDSQLEATAGLQNRKVVTVVNAGHNLFKTSPEVLSVMQAFMRGETIGIDEIIAPLPW
ncbi:alpha/beta fold hydrolase [Arenicella xantha]|uniref:Alpha/beta hydrolase family protein n=1 Tax=Arenicella xantha TaxID=644221 RepID=A0A395JL41_9GAMM|nr:alpha/beta hydrolase [Arenicella xantha]RBP51145.1 alpha/beta hydrolase family protein [Arenicella xantha]